MVESDELKPCPFCGVVPHELRELTVAECWCIDCPSCGITAAIEPTRQDCIEAWNTRAADPVKVALAEHLNSCVQWLYAIHEDAPDIWGTRVAKQRADDAEKALQEYRRECATNEAQ